MNDWVKKIDPKLGFYLAGFADGEGSFNVSIIRRPDYQSGIKFLLSFNVSQRDRVILALMKKILRCGHLRERKDGVVYFEVNNINSLKNNVVPFFERFHFLSANKKRNFSIFKKIVEMINNGNHLHKEGTQEILKLREELNKGKGRKRKYDFTGYKLISSKNGNILRDYTQDTTTSKQAPTDVE